MLEKPDLPDQLIIDAVRGAYGLQVARVTFLPIGYDVNTAVYRLVTEAGGDYFLKLRKGDFNEIAVALPHFLKNWGIQAIIAPLKTRRGLLWGSMDTYKLILFPFIPGRDGYEAVLSDQQWIDLGAALKWVHAAQIPPAFRSLIPQEIYSPQWREMVSAFQAQVETTAFDDPTAAKLAALMQTKRAEISHLVERADELGLALHARRLDFVLCHSDLHPGNLLISQNGRLYIVDWDNPVFAPRERDLMFVGAGMGSAGPIEREEALFYRGYGGDPGYAQTGVDPMALAYYRCERIVQDIAAFCEQLLLTAEGEADRERAYQYFAGQFLPNHEVDIALKTGSA